MNKNVVNLGSCRTSRKVALAVAGATSLTIPVSSAAGAPTRTIMLELTIVDPRIKRPIYNRRNIVRLLDVAGVEVAKADASINAILDGDGKITGYKMVSPAVTVPNTTATYSVVWSFVAAMPLSRLVESTETLALTAI